MFKSFTLLLVAFMFLAATHARSQTKWLKYEGNPVLDVGPPGAWDSRAARIDRVILRDSVYQMWYTGYTGARDPGPTVFPHIGYATST